ARATPPAPPAAPAPGGGPGTPPPPVKTDAQAAQSAEMKAVAAQRRGGLLFTGPMVRRAIGDAFVKLNPRTLAKNPVMFVVELGSVIAALAAVQALATGAANAFFVLQTTLWLWFTVLFANFAEAMAEARGRAQADTLRATRKESQAKRLRDRADPAG